MTALKPAFAPLGLLTLRRLFQKGDFDLAAPDLLDLAIAEHAALGEEIRQAQQNARLEKSACVAPNALLQPWAPRCSSSGP